jgi:hypothetical protein
MGNAASFSMIKQKDRVATSGVIGSLTAWHLRRLLCVPPLGRRKEKMQFHNRSAATIFITTPKSVDIALLRCVSVGTGRNHIVQIYNKTCKICQ